MKLSVSITVLLILGTLVTLTFSVDQCVPVNCFDCSKCYKNCNAFDVGENCDTDCAVRIRRFLCQVENETCAKVNYCDVPPVDITIYPASNYNETKKEWKSQTIEARKSCCYPLIGIYDNALSGLKNYGKCVQLFDGRDCTGRSVTVDSTWSEECLKWIDCPSRIKAGGIAFNDKTSSLRLC